MSKVASSRTTRWQRSIWRQKLQSGGDINPGLSQNITIVFDIPADAVPATLEVHDSVFSGGAEISLR
ncbi:DUF4352 domain-containing protein [Rhodococcus sp. IEGM 1354]|nr:DUF4352 domain-containing protein [Rhodococcus sp. IEGM 1354]MDI9932385.1 DUF4352 domain-containing protein [Rhodococcus sp. IEGM 1354]